MRRAGACAFAAIVAAACSTTPQPVAAQRDPTPPLPDTTSWAEDWPKTWADPRVVEALAAQCDFDPAAPSGESDHHPTDIFRCIPAYDQTCSPDVCASVQTSCEGKCTASCRDCGEGCTASCTSCKATCKDAACMKKCASTCAGCKQACGDAIDKCTSGACGAAHAACEKRVKESFKKGKCAAKCKTWQRCMEPCGEADSPGGRACMDKCTHPLSPGFEKCDEKCEVFRNAGRDIEADACQLECYVTEPCAPFLCAAVGGVR